MFNLISKKHLKNESGVAVILTVLLAGFFLAIILTLSAIFIPKLGLASDIKKSNAALYAAESAIEWCLYVNRIGSAAQPVMSNGATFKNGTTNQSFVEADCQTTSAKAIGTFQRSVRSFEISF